MADTNERFSTGGNSGAQELPRQGRTLFPGLHWHFDASPMVGFRLHETPDCSRYAARMTGLIITRQRLIGLALAGVLAAISVFWFYQPDRQLRRAWDGLLDAIEARNTTRLGRVLAEDYHDRWGYTRRSILDDARLAFFQFQHVGLTAEQLHIERTGDVARVTAILRLDADGGGQVAEARATVNALFTPFVFTWRREPGFAGAWQLVSFDQPELDLAKFRVRW